MLKIPKKVPEVGFYYHYKHNPQKGFRDYAYEVIGVGFHTENEDVFVNYRPMYKAAVFEASKKLGIPCTD